MSPGKSVAFIILADVFSLLQNEVCFNNTFMPVNCALARYTFLKQSREHKLAAVFDEKVVTRVEERCPIRGQFEIFQRKKREKSQKKTRQEKRILRWRPAVEAGKQKVRNRRLAAWNCGLAHYNRVRHANICSGQCVAFCRLTYM